MCGVNNSIDKVFNNIHTYMYNVFVYIYKYVIKWQTD